jgi:hypothetical protein
MNERIRELAEQAGFQYVKDEGIGWAGNYNASLPKFAELIIRECVNVLDKAQWDKGEDWECADGTRIIAQVKHHFGVEE